MKRRKFLALSSTLSVPLVLNGFGLSAFSSNPFSVGLNDPDKVLILIQLIGGNDGLNTLIPLKYYDNLANARPNIVIPENKIIKIDDDHGFHPAFAEVNDMYQDGFVHIVQGVAYPNQNRSHFRSTDIWSSASSAETFTDSGWLGRYFHTIANDFPNGYPNEDFPHPFALTIGSQVTETCQGIVSNFSMAIDKPEDLLPLNEIDASNFPDNKYGRELAYLVESISKTNAYAEVIQEAASQGNNLSTQYDDSNVLAQQLKTVALLISGGLKTQVFVVTLGGFDTHANQVEEEDPTIGRHSNLLSTLSKAVSSFWDDCTMLGINKRVMGMTFSEFGRQIKSNSGFGTDHGTAAPMFLFGDCLNPGMSGTLPVIDADIDPQEAPPMQFDFKSVYGNVLKNWLCADASTVNSILNHEVQDINIFGNCNSVSTADLSKNNELTIFPNPTRSHVNLKINVRNVSLQKISFFDHRGSDVGAFVRLINKSATKYQYDISRLPTGNYFIHVQMPQSSLVKKMVKI